MNFGSDVKPQITFKFCEIFLNFQLKWLLIIPAIYYVCVIVGPIILHASSTYMFSIQIAKHAFKKEVLTCFVSIQEI